jgi:hypothetical protein
MSWLEVKFPYDPDIKRSWPDGKLLGKWREEYAGSFLFCEQYLSRDLFPPKGRAGFNEFLIGIQYLEAGYDALFAFYRGQCAECYGKARALLGKTAADRFLTGPWKGGQPPDLLIFDELTGRFRFVECKGVFTNGRLEDFTKPQRPRFREIENCLSQTLTAEARLLSDPQNKLLFPTLSTDQWIQIARAVPEADPAAHRQRPRSRRSSKPDRPPPVAGPDHVVVGRLIFLREKLENEMRRFLAGEELARTKMQWWRKNLEAAQAALAPSPQREE